MSKEDVIEIEGIVREAMPNAIFKGEMLSEEMCIRDSFSVLFCFGEPLAISNRSGLNEKTILYIRRGEFL